jgi:hypothetical protein
MPRRIAVPVVTEADTRCIALYREGKPLNHIAQILVDERYVSTVTEGLVLAAKAIDSLPKSRWLAGAALPGMAAGGISAFATICFLFWMLLGMSETPSIVQQPDEKIYRLILIIFAAASLGGSIVAVVIADKMKGNRIAAVAIHGICMAGLLLWFYRITEGFTLPA